MQRDDRARFLVAWEKEEVAWPFPDERFAMVTRAQKKIVDIYSIDRLRHQALGIFKQARSLRLEAIA